MNVHAYYSKGLITKKLPTKNKRSARSFFLHSLTKHLAHTGANRPRVKSNLLSRVTSVRSNRFVDLSGDDGVNKMCLHFLVHPCPSTKHS